MDQIVVLRVYLSRPFKFVLVSGHRGGYPAFPAPFLLGDRIVVMSRRPGTLKAEFKVEFPRPRRVYDLKADPAFGQLSRKIWTLLREEVVP